MSTITIEGSSNDTNLVLDSPSAAINDSLQAVTVTEPLNEPITSTLATRSNIPCVVQCYFKALKSVYPDISGVLATVGGLATFQGADAGAVSNPSNPDFFMSSHSFVETDTHWIIYVSEICTQEAVRPQWGIGQLTKNAEGKYGLDGFAPFIAAMEEWNITLPTLDSNNFDYFTAKLANFDSLLVDKTNVHVAQAHPPGPSYSTSDHSAMWKPVMKFN